MKKLLLLLFILAGILFGGFWILNKTGGNNEYSKIYESYQVVYEDELLPKEDGIRKDGQYYLSLDAIKSYFDASVRYDESAKTVIFENHVGKKVIPLGKKEALINDAKIGLRDSAFEQDGKVYLPIEAFLYDYLVTVSYNKDKNVLLIDDRNLRHAAGKLSGDGVNMREEPSTDSPIVATLKSDAVLKVYGKDGDWFRVREADGYLGWIRDDNLEAETIDGEYIVKDSRAVQSKIPKPINITYDYTYGPVKEEAIGAIQPIEGLNVVIPTWFSVVNADGEIKDRGDIRYTDAYSKLGIDVWGYVDNSFDPELTHAFLQNTAAMEKAADTLIASAKSYGMKGINVDFENTKVEDRDGITEFTKMLAERCREENLVISVCVTPQISKSVEDEPYDRKALAEICDYVILMAYDQHWGSSDKAGSVAEYGWVEGNINLSLRDIPQEKFILSVPFYTRLWQENEGKTNSSAVGMQTTQNYITSHNLMPAWDDKAKQFMIEQNVGGKTEKIWVEDAESIRWKTSLMRKYNLAGVSSWRLGFETPDVWTTMANEFGKYQYSYR